MPNPLEFDEVYPFHEKDPKWWLGFIRWQRTATPADVSEMYPEGGVGYIYDNNWAIKWSSEDQAYLLELEMWSFLDDDLTRLEKRLFAYICGEFPSYLEGWTDNYPPLPGETK